MGGKEQCSKEKGKRNRDMKGNVDTEVVAAQEGSCRRRREGTEGCERKRGNVNLQTDVKMRKFLD